MSINIKKDRFRVLDAFRGIAAILVLIYHMPNLTILTNNQFIKNSGIFVDLFFVLSGFVIYHNYKGKISSLLASKSFLIKRFKRLIPLHVFTLLIMLLLELSKLFLDSYLPFNKAAFEGNTITSFWTQLFLLNSTPLFMGFNWNGANWSISAEIIAYIIFVILSLIWQKSKWKTIFFSFSIIIFGYLFFFFNYGSFDILADFNYSFIRGIVGFQFGIIAYLIRPYIFSFLSNKKAILLNIYEIIGLVITAYIVLKLQNVRENFYMLHLAFTTLILVFSFEKGIISKFLKLQIFQKLGLWSYSIYLNHIFVLSIFRMLFIKIFSVKELLLVIFEVLTILIIIIYSSFTYKYIEKRFYGNKNFK